MSQLTCHKQVTCGVTAKLNRSVCHVQRQRPTVVVAIFVTILFLSRKQIEAERDASSASGGLEKAAANFWASPLPLFVAVWIGCLRRGLKKREGF